MSMKFSLRFGMIAVAAGSMSSLQECQVRRG
jgi:hypothetical protein